jgi:hypothetical protein
MADLEKIIYEDAERIALLESRAAELERRLLAVMHPDGLPGWANVATPPGAGTDEADTDEACPDEDVFDQGPDDEDDEDDAAQRGTAASAAAERARALVDRGRPRARRGRLRGLRVRWRLVVAGGVALLAGFAAVLAAGGGPGAGWPASVAVVQGEIKVACANPDVAAEPGGLDFACAPGTRAVLWVFALLTSGDSPGFVDQATGRRGLEPVAPAQGGDIAWSLNLRHPYDPGSPVDSLMVAARAVNDIVYGAALTSPSGGALVEPGLEGSAAGCLRYTGSARLVTRPGYPAVCASPVSVPAGQAALVSDVFRRWVSGAPPRLAAEAGVLFENAGNPGSPQVRAILASLPAAGG